MTSTDGGKVTDYSTGLHPPPGIYGNYRVITLIFTKYGNLPLCLDNYALFSLPPIFTNNLYTYTLSNIIYLGEHQ